MRTLTLLFGGAVVVGCGIAASGGQDTLQELRAEPATDLTLPSATMSEKLESSDGSTLGKPDAATIQMRFSPDEGHSLDEILSQAVDELSAEGWDLQTQDAAYYQGTKEVGDRVIVLETYASTELDVVIVQLHERLL